MKNPQRGFTLIEMLLVVSILSVLSLAMFHTFANGIKIWERSRHAVVEEDIAIFFDKISSDLRNSYFFSLIPFKGRDTTLRFATRIRSKRFPNETTLGEVEYYFKPEKNEIIRKELNYGQSLERRAGSERTLVRSIKGLNFSYFYRDGNTMAVQTQVDTIIPAGVAVEVDVQESGGQRKLRKLILIPFEI